MSKSLVHRGDLNSATIAGTTNAVIAGVATFLDLRDLLALRRMSRQAMQVVCEELERWLERLVGDFVPDPVSFIHTITQEEAYIGGDVAARFLLRSARWNAETLEVYVGQGHAWRIENNLAYEQGAWYAQGTARPALYSGTDVESERASQGIFETTTWTTPRGRKAIIHETTSGDPFTTIVRTWSTHEVVYANGAYFGCGYRDLFFAGRGILGREMSDEALRVKGAMKRGNTVRYRPHGWEDMALKDCGASQWACASQTRTLTDGGALALRMNPLEYEALAAELRWKMDSRPCGGLCSADGGVAEIAEE